MHVNVETQMLLVSERTMSPTGLLNIYLCNLFSCPNGPIFTVQCYAERGYFLEG